MNKLKKAPFFLPLAGCRGQCVYCDQRAITGQTTVPSPRDVAAELDKLEEPREVCYFGGSFCRFPIERVKEYLDAVRLHAPEGSSIRFSTYPGDLSDDTLRALVRGYPISRVELGIPTLDPAVLSACRREADPDKIIRDIELLMRDGLPIGVQMMAGLPGQSSDSSMADLRRLAMVKGGESWELRLYPCLVIRGTELERLWRSGAYRPLSVDEAAEWGGRFIDEALTLGFVPIRIGLQETLSLAAEVCAGPHHPALGELILAEADAIRMRREAPEGPWRINKREISRFTGHGAYGIRRLALHTGLSQEEVRSRIVTIEEQDVKR